jgi:hypothetical protein
MGPNEPEGSRLPTLKHTHSAYKPPIAGASAERSAVSEGCWVSRRARVALDGGWEIPHRGNGLPQAARNTLRMLRMLLV